MTSRSSKTYIYIGKAHKPGCGCDKCCNSNNTTVNTGIQLPEGGQDGDYLGKNGSGLIWITPPTTTTTTSTTTTSTTTTSTTTSSTTSSTTTTTGTTTTTSTTTTSSTTTTTLPPTFIARWGWKDTNAMLNDSEVLGLNESGNFTPGGTITANFQAGNATPKYLYMAEPITQSVKTSWYGSSLRNGSIGISPEVFKVLGTTATYRIYISNFATDFTTTTQFLV